MASSLKLEKKTKFFRLFLILLSFLLFGCAETRISPGQLLTVSPFDYGLAKAKTGVERYRVLYETHKAAVATGKRVSYEGIKSIDIEIPSNAKSIPLSSVNDFAGIKLTVLNKGRNINLFSFERSTYAITISKSDIDKGDFRKYPQLREGKKILVIEDTNPWVENREGYSYGHTRKDILLLDQGRALNQCIMPYNNEASSPQCSYYDVSTFSLSNIKFTRKEGSTYKTFLFFIKGFDDVHIANITIDTPTSELTSDAVMRLYDCTNVSFDNVTVNGTYSQKDHSGYAFSLNNIWSLRVNNLQSRANWSVFGTNNVQNVILENSNTNNFDIHCYGRNLEFRNVQFSGRYVQLASVFGSVTFRNCAFSDARVVTNGMSYNAYVGYDLVLEDCTFNATRSKRIIFDFGRLDNRINVRRELSKRCLPNITVKNLKVNILEDLNEVYLMFFRTEGEFSRKVEYLSSLNIDGVSFNYPTGIQVPANLYISNVPIPLAQKAAGTIQNVDVIGSTTQSRANRGKIIRNLNYQSSPVGIQTRSVKAITVE